MRLLGVFSMSGTCISSKKKNSMSGTCIYKRIFHRLDKTFKVFNAWSVAERRCDATRVKNKKRRGMILQISLKRTNRTIVYLHWPIDWEMLEHCFLGFGIQWVVPCSILLALRSWVVHSSKRLPRLFWRTNSSCSSVGMIWWERDKCIFEDKSFPFFNRKPMFLDFFGRGQMP